MNLTIIKKNHAADPEKVLLKKSISTVNHADSEGVKANLFNEGMFRSHKSLEKHLKTLLRSSQT